MPNSKERNNSSLFVITVFLATMISLLIFNTAYSNENEDYVEKGQKLFNKGEFKEAEKKLIKAIKKRGDSIPALLALGNLYRYQGKNKEAEELFRKAIELDPYDSNNYIELGKILRLEKRYSEAEKAFFKAIELDPENDSIYGYGLGYMYRDMGEMEKAEEMFRKALELSQSSYNYMAIGDYLRDVGDYDESEKMLQKSLELDPKSEAYLGVGWLYQIQGKYDKAEEMFLNYLRILKPKGEVYVGLGYVYLEQKQYDKAEEMFEKANALNPEVGGVTGLEFIKKARLQTD